MGLAFIVRGLRCLGLYTYLSVIIYACLGFHLLTFCQSCLGWGGFRWVLTFWQVWVYRAGRGWVVMMMISVLGAHACVRVYACARVRVRVCARNYGFILVLCLASILFFLVLVFWLDLLRV